ncbi:hypothetical protein E2C01_085833 [Portunus trituberculatus]|uniref:Uncharacterized protein n=1 Tax=Portunus trituberculatus TaxID=210409 RepID=A0A5B7J221_PORTR|nr:hypothetical protein [Portunus trituberculatus]
MKVTSSLMDKQDLLITENTTLKLRVAEYEKVNAINQALKEEIQEAEVQDGITDRAEDGLGDNKFKELRNEWKQELEEEKVKFSEVVRREIQENTKVAVIEVIKEKEDLVQDAVDKKRRFDL